MTDEYTCVCCYEGSVALVPQKKVEANGGEQGDGAATRVDSGRTRLVFATGESEERELVASHRAPLVQLAGFWQG